MKQKLHPFFTIVYMRGVLYLEKIGKEGSTEIMEKERYLVFDNEKGVLVPLKQGGMLTAEEKNEKAEKIQLLLKSLIKQTVKDTIREYNADLKEEWKKYEQKQENHWKEMEQHFRGIDESIREKQNNGKRKKHSIF